MKQVRVITAEKEEVVLSKVDVADTFFTRLRGLLGRKLNSSQGLVLKPCKSVHTIGMGYPIDICFINQENRVCYLRNNMQPNRLTPLIKNAVFVIEAAAGTFQQAGLAMGDEIRLDEYNEPD
jgi:uncharacterized membrane protein (UPF0127 family)